MNQELQQKIIQVLMLKKQVVLQGPPGTGKTYIAKQVAEKLKKAEAKGSVSHVLNEYLKAFDSESEETKNRREKERQLLSTFYSRFPKEKINQLSLESYCAGRGDKNNFCWWIEHGLKTLGKYSPGSARSYLIYWSKRSDSYNKQDRFKDLSDDELFEKLKDKLIKLIVDKNIEEAEDYFGNGLILKILNTYYPEEYFPINSVTMINHALVIVGKDGGSLDVFEKNRLLNEAFLEMKDKLGLVMSNQEFAQILYKFDLKNGSDITTEKQVVVEGEYELVQFHPNYSYEDFVRGIVSVVNNGQVAYQVENKTLVQFADKAKANPNGKYVLIIDEINRANLPVVLGELIYALEYRGEAVTSLYEYQENDDLPGDRDISLPDNLYIIGTMNTADRSIGHIDYAIRRRFAFIDILPNSRMIGFEQAKKCFEEVKELFTKHLSPEIRCKDIQLGHSYFLVKTSAELELNLEYEIKPLLYEYVNDGILLESALDDIKKISVD